MISDPLFWLGIAAAVFACIAATAARALEDFSRRELQELSQREEQPERYGEILRGHKQVALGVEMLEVVGTCVLIAALALWAVRRWGDGNPPPWPIVLAGGVVLGLILTVLKVWLPWSISRLYAAPFLYNTWGLWRRLGVVLSPLTLFARVLDTALHRIAGRTPSGADEETFGEEIRTIVTEGHREGLLEEEARGMIEGVIELGDADVAEIMTPRTDMHMIPVEIAWDDLLADVIAAGHTRIPVYETSRDDIVGVLYVKDLLPEFAKGDGAQRPSLRDLVRKPLFVPETKAVDDLLQMFQQTRTHIALVLDEYGGVAGLVTIEDVLEEIVGEIVDEYDEEAEQEIVGLSEGVCEALGRAHVDEINDALSVELPEDGDYDTIAGFVFTELGRVPVPGESVLYHEAVRVTVLEATKRRIDRVRVERLSDRGNGAAE
ncbi:Magnesium and cobalt efflux protein CorC [Pirellulimonas nuda]|uniref:Magnesium and cobalt efflux protein CorC n=1 Tax=Pirellulimonas nuda TaxID=2528009 RepID=A0A518D6C3_9BACT|nr:hemolysin family protein [Pirellulimonas nuda]QDU87023.1 Magnesium and cobalt efflux protein CorC [Pirellulimonas nuda]